jgi:hypothetical protein
MSITGFGTARLRLKLRIMSDEDLWWLFLHHRESVHRGFWEDWNIEKRLASYPKTVHFGRCATVTREVPAAIPT